MNALETPRLLRPSEPWRDFIWQFFCELGLVHPPRLQIESRIVADRFYRFLDRTRVLQELALALLFYALGGVSFVVWGIFVRTTFSMFVLYQVGYFAHNSGSRDWHLKMHAVQDHNVPYLGLLTMGESWHDNHHAFPVSAKLGVRASQGDAGWWVLSVLRSFGFVWNVKLPSLLSERPELARLEPPLAGMEMAG